MTDDLVKRLREVKDWWREPGRTAEEAADRIEAMEKMLDATGSINSKLTEIASSRLDRIEALEAARDGAYTERNRLVALLASIYPSGVKKTAIPGWDKAWHGCVYIDTPQGQASWHFHDSEAHLFANLPPYEGEWDGHTTEEKYERIARAALGEKKDG